jgi:hypothetical protein
MMVDHEQWQKAWLQYCRLYNAPKDVLITDMITGSEGADASYVRDGRLAAYIYLKTGNEAFLNRAINSLVPRRGRGQRGLEVRRIEGPDVLNPLEEGPSMDTNSSAQNSLTTIAVLGMIGGKLPEEIPQQDQRNRSFRGGPTAGSGDGGRRSSTE